MPGSAVHLSWTSGSNERNAQTMKSNSGLLACGDENWKHWSGGSRMEDPISQPQRAVPTQIAQGLRTVRCPEVHHDVSLDRMAVMTGNVHERCKGTHEQLACSPMGRPVGIMMLTHGIINCYTDAIAAFTSMFRVLLWCSAAAPQCSWHCWVMQAVGQHRMQLEVRTWFDLSQNQRRRPEPHEGGEDCEH